MITSPTPGSIAVVGGGIAGLVAAVEAIEIGAGPVTLIDNGPGRARTIERDGVLLNEGAHALYLAGELATALRRWGIEPPGGQPDLSDYWAVDGDRLTRFPTSPRALATTHLLGMRGKASFAKLQMQLGKLRPQEIAGRSVAEWLADQPADVRRVVETVVRLTCYVNAPDQLDAGAFVNQMQLAVSGGVRYVDGGWASITDGLHRRLVERGGTVVAGQARRLTTHEAGVTIELADGVVDTEAAVLATGGPATAARLLGIDLPPAWDLPPVEVSCLDLWTSRRPTGSVVLDPDRHLYLSTHAPVADLAPPGVTLVSLFHYLPAGDGPADHDIEQALLLAHAARAGLTDEVVLGRRYLHRMTVAHGFPLAERRGAGPGVEVPGTARVFVAGDWLDAGAMLADASAASGREAAGAAVALTRQPAGAGRG
jgi:hypothetical protein